MWNLKFPKIVILNYSKKKTYIYLPKRYEQTTKQWKDSVLETHEKTHTNEVKIIIMN